MRHQVSGYRLGRTSGARLALRRNLIKQFFTHERIQTTRAKAAAIRGDAERMITIARNSAQAKRESPPGGPDRVSGSCTATWSAERLVIVVGAHRGPGGRHRGPISVYTTWAYPPLLPAAPRPPAPAEGEEPGDEADGPR